MQPCSHRNRRMAQYDKRTARTFEELNTGELAPLFDAIPELSIAPGLSTNATNMWKSGVTPTGIEPVLPT
jgi:hypothetical protein